MEVLLKNPDFAQRMQHIKFQQVVTIWQEAYPNFWISLFCHPPFFSQVENLSFCYQFDKLRKLFAERHFEQSIGILCDLIANPEFCNHLTNPHMFHAIEELNSRYPICDLIQLFTTSGFCIHILNPVFYMNFLQFEKTHNTVKPFTNCYFVSQFLQTGFLEKVNEYIKLLGIEILTCQSFVKNMMQIEFQNFTKKVIDLKSEKLLHSEVTYDGLLEVKLKYLLSLFSIKQTCKILKNPCFQCTHITSTIAMFGLQNAYKLLKNKDYCKYGIHYEWVVQLFGSEKACKLLILDFFLIRMNDLRFQQNITFLITFYPIDIICKLLQSKFICCRFDDLQFVTQLDFLMNKIGSTQVVQTLPKHDDIILYYWEPFFKIVKMMTVNQLYHWFLLNLTINV
jgi:hypothetical protein